MRACASVLLVAGVCVLPVRSDDTSLSGPVPGFVFHTPSKSIRPIIGVPGSAYLGPAIAQGFDAASVSPLGKSALATQGGKLSFLQGLDTGQPAVAQIDGAIEGVDRIAWGPDGVSAAVYSSGSRSAQILRNLDGSQSPSIESALDLSPAEGDVSALVFDGKRLIAAAAGVYTADQSGVKALFRTAHPSALALGVGNRDLFVADQDSNQIWIIRDYTGDATPMMFADERVGLSAPVGLRVAGNGRTLLIANSGNLSVDALEISTRTALKHLDLDFAPSRIEAVGSGALALLNAGAGGEPLYLIDGGDNLAVYFVPAGSEN